MSKFDPDDQKFLARVANVFNNAFRSDASAQGVLLATSSSLCNQCGAPTAGYPMCFKCGQEFRGTPWDHYLPDVCAPLTYAISDQQSGTDIYAYKDPSRAQPALMRLQILVYFFVKYHLSCLASRVGLIPTHAVSVPSGKGRISHPLRDDLLPYLGGVLENREVKRSAPKRAANVRQTALEPSLFDVGEFNETDHVVVLEDTWVSGANCLSLAIALRQAGAGAVSIVPVARLLVPTFKDTKAWLSSNAPLPLYDPLFCPVSRSSICP